jgi:hypothetical protein
LLITDYGEDFFIEAARRYANTLVKQGVNIDEVELKEQWNLLKTLVLKKYAFVGKHMYII